MKNFKDIREQSTKLTTVSEEKMALSSRLFKQFKKDIEKIMKKHDAYVSDSNTKYTQISSPKPMKGGFRKDLFNLLGMTEETVAVLEGTWAIPSTIEKMKKFQGLLQKPMFAKNKASVEKFKNSIYSLMGDDQLFDVYDKMIMDKEFNGENMVELLVKSLEGRWFNFKKKGKGWVATHQYFEMEPEDDVEEGKARPTGYYKPKRKMKTMQIESIEEAYKDPSKEFPRDRDWKALCRKHKRHIMALQQKGKDLPNDAEEDFVQWGMENGKINDSDDIENFIDQHLLNASFEPTGNTISEKYRSKYRSSDVAKAVAIAHSMGGNMTGAYEKIEKIKKGLGEDPIIQAALRIANEGVTNV